ncbi:hypothetical protein V2605_14390 [Tenacibaculum maritimum]|uniref:hypothetical protein n=2 Tax=Tenacibaculum maritimum TaxID=107401 RepID=UPI0012E63F8D|nr:hypothetical protein [Tenacibaculum maritimum]CAA0210856.1 hypothetical protein DPIF8902391_30024 [Tenacibaculum maritimum]
MNDIFFNIKKQALLLYGQGAKTDAYSLVWNEIPFNKMVDWYLKKTKKAFFKDDFFYNSFLTKQSAVWVRETKAIELWKNYLKNYNSIEFEYYVAYNNPDLFIEGYKETLLFLDNSRLLTLKNGKLPPVVKEEILIWEKLSDLLNTTWNKVSCKIKGLNKSKHEFIVASCAAFEAYVYNNNQDPIKFQYGGDVLSILIAYAQSEIQEETKELTYENIYQIYLEEVLKKEFKSIFTLVNEYVMNKDVVYRYAYEPRLKVKINDIGEIVVLEDEVFNIKWNYDADRYSLNENMYYKLGVESYAEHLEKGQIIFHNNNKSEENIMGNALCNGIKLAINDLGLKEKEMKNKIPLLTAITFLQGLATRKYHTFIKPLHDTASKRKSTYIEGTLSLQNKELILISDVENFHQMTNNSGIKCSTENMEKIISNFSFNWKTNRKIKKFDPFKLTINLWQKPFIKLGGNIIAPMSILTSFVGLYAITEALFKNFKPDDGTSIENILCEYYKDMPWDTKIELASVQEKGDVDVIMEDDLHIVYLQLKRTSQKTNTFELAKQKKQDKKAISQLQLAAATYKGKKQIHLWYVSTALEGLGIKTNNVFKVGYQDLLHISRLNLYSNKLKSLKGFIEIVETDQFYKDNRNNN